MELSTVRVLVLFMLVLHTQQESLWPTTEGSLEANQSNTESHTQCPEIEVFSNFTMDNLREIQHDPSRSVEDGFGMAYFSPGPVFTLKGEVVIWGNWKQSFEDFADANKDCVYIDQNLKWGFALCNESYYGLCQKEKSHCDDDEDSRYCKWNTYQKGTMAEVEKVCQLSQSSLAVFSQISWLQFIKANLVSRFYKLSRGIWIGMRRSSVNWRSVKGGNLTWTNWKEGEPRLGGNRHCAIMTETVGRNPATMERFEWIAEDCSNTHNAVLCQWQCTDDKSTPKHCLRILNSPIPTNISGITELCRNNSLEIPLFTKKDFDLYTSDPGQSLLGLKIWIPVTNRLWYSIYGSVADDLPWDETQTIKEENKHCAKVKVHQVKDYPNLLKPSIFVSSCIVHKSQAIPALCDFNTNGSKYIKKTQESFTNINDAYRNCKMNGALMAIPSFFLVFSPQTFTEGEELWIGITDDPRYWYNASGDLVEIAAMGSKGENCMKGVPLGGDKYELAASRCTLSDCPDQTEVTTDQGVTSSGEFGYCNCPCPKEYNTTTLPEEIATIRAAVKKALVLEKKNLSASTRRYHSVPDYRPSAQYLGSTAIVLLALTVVIIITPDLIDVVNSAKKKLSGNADG